MARLLIDALPAAPDVHADIVVEVSVGRRNRAFDAHDLVGAFTVFERRLARLEGDTRVSTQRVGCLADR